MACGSLALSVLLEFFVSTFFGLNYLDVFGGC
jgi:hypothetical protein